MNAGGRRTPALRGWLLAAAVVVGFMPASRLLDGLVGPAPVGGTTASAAAVPPAPFADTQGSGPATTADTAVVALARRPRLQLYEAPTGIALHRTLRSAPGAPLVLLVTRRRGPEWIEVEGPDAAVGWVRRAVVGLSRTDWHTRVDLSDRTVTTWRGRRLVSVHPVRLDPAAGPVRLGRAYLARRRSDGFVLSAGGIALSSRDGIRVQPEVIASFLRHFPLGTPVVVRP